MIPQGDMRIILSGLVTPTRIHGEMEGSGGSMAALKSPLVKGQRVYYRPQP